MVRAIANLSRTDKPIAEQVDDSENNSTPANSPLKLSNEAVPNVGAKSVSHNWLALPHSAPLPLNCRLSFSTADLQSNFFVATFRYSEHRQVLVLRSERVLAQCAGRGSLGHKSRRQYTSSNKVSVPRSPA